MFFWCFDRCTSTIILLHHLLPLFQNDWTFSIYTKRPIILKQREYKIVYFYFVPFYKSKINHKRSCNGCLPVLIIYCSDSKICLKFYYAMKMFSRWNFDKKSSHICRGKILLSLKKKFIKIGSVVFELIYFLNSPIFSKPINCKTTEPILINFFVKKSRIFSLQICKFFFSTFHLGKILIA